MARHVIAIVCAILIIPGNTLLSAPQARQTPQQTPQQTGQPAPVDVKIPPDQLDSLVAPIALYPDPLLSQTLVASTYPLEIIQLQQWLEKNKNLKDKALVDAVSKQPWDPSVQAMAPLPDVVKFLADDIQWTTDLGNAFLAQQSDVMDAVQRMRKKAQDKGTLMSNDKQKVETQVVQDKSVIVVEQAQPDVVYVPSYEPTAVYGAPVYPYPSIAYPGYYPGAVAAGAISFGVGVAMGAAWGGGWGWGAGWGGNDIDMNFNNSFNRNTSANRTANNKWQHNPQHRGGTPYSNRATANRFGSNARGDSLASRQQGARQQISRQKSTPGGARAGAGGARAGAGGARAGAGSARAGAGGARAGGGNLGGAGSRAGGGARSSFGGGDRIGNRSVGAGSSMGNRGGFGSGGGFSGSSARSSRSRGSSSMGGGRRSGGGGGRSRGGGGGRGGGRR